MRQFMTLGLALAVAAFVGCNNSERGGQTSENTRASETFKVKAPATATTIKQGDKQTVKLSLDRGKDFKRSVTLKSENPTGISVDLDPRTVKASDGDTVTASVSVAKDAPVGEHNVRVTATPEKGNSAEVDFKVKVEKKTD